MSVVIETTLGDITVDLYVAERPQTCLNFLKLCKLKYYNLNLFHSVNSNFCAQTGDPTGKGDGGMSIHGILNGPEQRFYQGESQPKIKHNRTGLLSMASHGNGLLGSQFIITLNPDMSSLDGEHCVFGEVAEGQELLLKLNEAITDEQHRPYQDIRITHTVILDDPFPDPPGMLTPPPSPSMPSTKDAAYSRIPADEPLADECTQEELNEMVQAREAAARAAILEMVGDLPDADVAPPENVLFVCKLNPVTSDHDLSIIFSRFGKVKSCEVIRDSVSGDSLQYAFVEFDNPKSCEEAYFKMDNVLIDDRRIHVDFSQSVAKWRGKGKGAEMLGPPPKGGWGNKTKSHSRPNDRPRMNHFKPREQEMREVKKERNYEEHHENRKFKTEPNEDDKVVKNGSKSSLSIKNKVVDKKGFQKKKRRRSPSSSSTSSSDSSDTTSSTDSSESEPVKKKSRRRSDKVLVVVKTPRKRNRKKVHKSRTKSKKYESDSDSEVERVKKRKRKSRRKSSSEDSSSEDNRKVKRGKKKSHSSEEDAKVVKKKKKGSESSSANSSDEVSPKKGTKKKKKQKVQEDSTSEEERRRRKKKVKRGNKKKSGKKKRRAKSVSDTTSSSD